MPRKSRAEGPILGFDSETYMGFPRVFACSDGHFIESQDTDELLSFIRSRVLEQGARYAVLWNLGFDIAAILKSFVIENAEHLREAHYRKIAVEKKLKVLNGMAEVGYLKKEDARERKALQLELDGMETIDFMDTPKFHVEIVGTKGFGLRLRKTRTGKDSRESMIWIFDAAVFYSQGGYSSMRLEDAASRYLGEHKSDVELGIDRARIGNELGYYESHREDIIRYCIQDADLTRKLMERTIEGYAKIGFPFPKRPFSKGSVSKEYLRTSGCLDKTQERYALLSGNAMRSYWSKSFVGGVFLLRAAGHFPHPYDLDIASAYPDACRKFPSLEGAYPVLHTSPEFDDPRTFFRFFKVRMKATPRTPLRPKASTRKIYGYTEDEHEFYLAEPDLRILRHFGDAFEIVDGVGILCPHTSERPLAFLDRVFVDKDRIKHEFGKNSIEYLNVKVVANGVYGILAQRKPRESRFTNLIYASYVTALCREKLWLKAREVEQGGDFILQYATDGLLVADRTNGAVRSRERESASEELGAWTYEELESVTMFESGVYVREILHEGRHIEELRKRGFPDLTSDVLRGCSTKAWTSHREAPIKLRSGLIQRRTEEIGVFVPTERVLCPLKAAFDAGFSYPDEFASASLRDYFTKQWPLKMRGEK